MLLCRLRWHWRRQATDQLKAPAPPDGGWVDAEPTRYVVRAFKTLAENIAESLAKRDRVFVHGSVTTEAWTDKHSGEKRTAQRVLAEIVGPSLRWATTRITKTTRTSASDENT